MRQKGVYPYDCMDIFEKFNDPKLLTKKDFYSMLTNTGITDEQYQQAQKVWSTFRLQNMGQYHDLYLKSGVLLLADVFENFRKTSLENIELDPVHYFTTPGLSWDVVLKMTGIKLELINDIDQYQFIKKGMHGGTSYIAHRYGEANNKHMSNYEAEKTSKYLMYLHTNNLYGWAMMQYLPYGGFRWLTEKQIEKLVKKDNIPEDNKKGYILEVDLEYPTELCNLHNDYPCAPEKMNITKDMLSPYCKQIQEKFGICIGQVSKLVPTLLNKTKYVLHYRNLQLYLELGLTLEKVHRVLEFNQSPWLKQYIEYNTNKRMQAKNAFEKDFFKLMINSVSGKTIENLRKRVDVRLVTDHNQYLKMVSKPSFSGSKAFNENLVAVHEIKECLTLDRPAYVGMCILDLSKTPMYDFHYNTIKKMYGNKARLLFTDTDSLCYEIATEDAYQDIWSQRDLYDFSDYAKNSPFYNASNKKVPCKFKDECGGLPMGSFIGLRSKMYSYLMDNGKNNKTCKGVKKDVIKKNISHRCYEDVLFNNKEILHKMNTIRGDHHRLSSYQVNKISLSCFDDKRYIL